MKEYEVTITETLQKTVTIRAEDLAHAEEIAEAEWNKGNYVLDAENFVGASFDAVVRNRTKDLER